LSSIPTNSNVKKIDNNNNNKKNFKQSPSATDSAVQRQKEKPSRLQTPQGGDGKCEMEKKKDKKKIKTRKKSLTQNHKGKKKETNKMKFETK